MQCPNFDDTSSYFLIDECDELVNERAKENNLHPLGLYFLYHVRRKKNKMEKP